LATIRKRLARLLAATRGWLQSTVVLSSTCNVLVDMS
jgi:hypothetical protein